jgi:hypothetical protein
MNDKAMSAIILFRQDILCWPNLIHCTWPSRWHIGNVRSHNSTFIEW